MDTYAGSLILAGADVDNHIGSDGTPVDVALSGGDYTPYDLLVEARRLLNAQDAPEEGRWAVINEDLEATFLHDEFYIAVAGPETRTGQIGRVAGFDILRTTSVPTSQAGGGSIKMLFGAGNYALTWADQITKMEAYRIERQFGDALKTLNVYGAKVIEPESIGVAHVSADVSS